MAITTDPAEPVGRVRLLCTDLDQQHPLFTDEQIEAFLDMEDDVRCAAALALETIASSEALVSKKIRTQDLQTDGPAVAAALLARAQQLRAQAAAAAADDSDGIYVVDYDPDSWLLTES